MEEENSNDKEEKELLIDGDIIVYRTCCSNNEDTELDKRIIVKKIKIQLARLIRVAKTNKYRFFITSTKNFRNFVTDDYKLNRLGKERPINLQWAKEWVVENIGAEFVQGLEADDLLAIYSHKNSITWSIDKDIRQIPGVHIDKDFSIMTVTKFGSLKAESNGKIYFDGVLGFYYQLLIGDTADYIIGCGKREEVVYKTGKKKGETATRRRGVGPGEAYKIIHEVLDKAQKFEIHGEKALDLVKNAVATNYLMIFEDDWQEMLEKQANLLFMVQEVRDESVKRWTFDGREEYMNYLTGDINEYPT